MKKILVLLLCCLLPFAALAEDAVNITVTTADGLLLSHTLNRDRIWQPESNAECMTQAYLIWGEYGKAFTLNQQLADLGDWVALSRLGAHYLSGVGVAQDEQMGYTLLLQAAEAGVQHAQLDVVRCVLNGWGTEADATEAARLMESMVASCDAVEHTESYTATECRLMLATLYRCGGADFPADPERAQALFTEATAETLKALNHGAEVCADPVIAPVVEHLLTTISTNYAEAEAIWLSGTYHPLLTQRPTPDLLDMGLPGMQDYVWYGVAQAYEENGLYEEAARLYETIIANGDSTEATFSHYALGDFYATGKLGYDPGKAIDHYFTVGSFSDISDIFRSGVTGPDGTVYLAPDARIAAAFQTINESYPFSQLDTCILLGDYFRDGGPVPRNPHLAAYFYYFAEDDPYAVAELTKLYKAGEVTNPVLLYRMSTDLPYSQSDVSELILLLADDLIHERITVYQPNAATKHSIARKLLSRALEFGKLPDPAAAEALLALIPENE